MSATTADDRDAAPPPTSSSELPRLPAHEQSRYGAAAEYALRLYPGPVGELIHRELLAYARFGRGFATDALIPHLMREILRSPGSPSAHGAGASPTCASTTRSLTVPGPDLWPRPGASSTTRAHATNRRFSTR